MALLKAPGTASFLLGAGYRGDLTLLVNLTQDFLPCLEENLAIERFLPGYRLDLELFDQNLFFFSQEKSWVPSVCFPIFLGLVNGAVLKDREKLAVSPVTVPRGRKSKGQGCLGLTSSFL